MSFFVFCCTGRPLLLILASSVPTLYACCLTKRMSFFVCCTGRPLLLILRFFWYRQTSLKVFYIGRGNGDSWNHMCAFRFQQLKYPPLFQLYMRRRSLFWPPVPDWFQCLWLMATGRATREALLVPKMGPWGKAGCIFCLNPVWFFLLFRFVWWLDCLLLNEGAMVIAWSVSCCCGVCGFSRRWSIFGPKFKDLAPWPCLDSYRFQPRKKMNYDLFSQSRY